MPETTTQLPSVDLEERKQQIIEQCAADRAAWVNACRADHRKATITGALLHWSDMLGAVLPGRFGRWFRGASFLAGFARNITRVGRLLV
ncbi:MAG TPA: hypothetical protein VFJ90_14355 [Candidatus Didemnitutus sp.]|nr:hypothetical protein [Candidatus Didemnitutus sp.]